MQPETDDAETAAPSDDFAPESSETVGDSYVADAVITYCGMPEHIHSEACYNRLGELICEVEEHVHTELCYAPENYGIMTASIVHEELSEEGYDFVIAINASGGYTLTFTGTKIPDNSTLRKLLTIDGTNYFPLINMVVINDSVTEIGASAFINMHGLVAVDFQGVNSHITELPTNCFANCQSLNSVDLDSLIALDNIGLNAFNNSGIKSITIPSTVRTIDPNAFISTNSLETVYFEENYVMTNPPSFSNMKALKNINLENLKADTVYIPDRMFAYCTSLETLYIPSNFSQREKPNGSYENVNSLCSGCTSLKELIFAPNPRINALAFCTESTQIETLDLTPLTNLEYFREFNNTNLKSITFASDLDTSGGVCIDGCSSLETITFQKDVLAETTAYEAFDGCSSLLAVDLNKFVNLKTINTGTFNKCSSISELSIPSTVTKINPTAFANMTSLRSFTLNANIEKCSTDIFNGTPGFVLTIGEDVSVLNRDFLIAANGHTSDIVFPSNAVFTLPAGNLVGGIFGDGTGEQTYLTDGDGNLYLLEDGGLSLVYAKKSLESVNIPASVGGHNVTGIASNAFKDSAAKSVTVKDPSAVTLSEFAFTDAADLASVNDKTEAGEIKELFANSSSIPDAAFEGTKISNDTKKDPKEDLSSSSAAPNTKAKYGNNEDGISVTGDKSDLLTGETANIELNVSNYGTEFYRVYVMASDMRWFTDPMITSRNEDNFSVEGPKKVPEKNIWYFDFIPTTGGNTDNSGISITTLNYPTPSGTSAYVWAAALSKENLSDSGIYYPGGTYDNAYVSPNYVQIDWNTKHKDFTLEKKRIQNATQYPLEFQKSAADGAIALKPIAYSLALTSGSAGSSGSGTEYGADYVTEVEFTDTFNLPEGLKWRDGISTENIRKVLTGSSASVYAVIGEKEYLVAQVSGFGGVAGNITDIKLDKTDDKLSVVWTVENSSLETSRPSEISIDATSAMISFGGDIILRDESRPEITSYTVNNDVKAHITYTHGDHDDLNAKSDDATVNAGEGKLSMSKTLVGNPPTRMNEPAVYNIRIWNESAYNAPMLQMWDWLNNTQSYIEPEEIERLFREETYGEYLEITVSNAYFLNSGESVPTEQFTAVDGETVGTPSYLDSTVNDLSDYPIYDESAVDPVTGQTELTEGRYKRFNGSVADVIYTYDTATKRIKMSYSGVNKTIGEGGDYSTLAEAMEKLKMYVGRQTGYLLKWRTVDKGITFAPGEEVNIRVNTRTKDSFMMLEGDVVPGEKTIYSRDAMHAMDVDYHYRAGWNGEATHDWQTNTWFDTGTRFEVKNAAALKNSADEDVQYVESNDGNPYYIKNDLDIIKDAIIDGTEYGTQDGGNERITEKLRLDMDMDYVLRLKHWGTGTYDTLPVVDHMEGLQVVLAPVDLNSGAEWTAYTELHYVGGRAYYALNLNGVSGGKYTYKGVQFDKYYCDRIEVAETKESGVRTGFDTLLYFYFVDTLPIEYEQVIQYKITTNREICLGKDAGSLEKWSLNNGVWVNDIPGRRITENLIHDGTLLKFEKKITLERAGVPALDKVADISGITESKNTVLYRMRLYNNSADQTINLTGKQIYDLLPQTYDKFTWSTENVSLEWVKDSSNPKITYGEDGEGYVDVEIVDGKMSTTGAVGELWEIKSGDGDRQIIDFDDKLKFSFAPQQSIYFYVTLTFPTGDDWDNYHDEVTKGSGEEDHKDKPVENSLFVYGMEDRVEHTLINPGKAFLQKGVYEIGTYNVSDPQDRKFYDYYIGRDRTHYSYNTEGKRDQQKVQLNTVTYYIIIENTGEGKLYLNDVYDVLPEGFEFLSLRAAVGTKWLPDNGDNWYMATWTGMYVGGIGVTTSIGEAVSGGFKNIVVRAADDAYYSNEENENTSRFRQVKIAATTDGSTVKFTFSKRDSANKTDISYDDNGVYLNEGEYTQIVFTAVTGSQEDLEKSKSDTALNSAFMEYYVPGLDEANVTVDTEAGVSVSDANNLAPNDGDRKLWSKKEAEATGVKNLETHNKNNPVFLASSVEVIPGDIIPGVQKTLDGDAARQYSAGVKDINWKVKLFNDGDAAMPFDFEDTIQYPLRFSGKMDYTLYEGVSGIYTAANETINGRLLRAATQPTDGKDYLFNFTKWDKDSNGDYVLINTHIFDKSDLNEYKLYVNGDLYKLNGGSWNLVSTHMVKLNLSTTYCNHEYDASDPSETKYYSVSTFTFFVPIYLTKDAETGDLTFRVEFSNANIDENGSRPMPYSLAIPAGGHVDMTVNSEMPSGLDVSQAAGSFINSAKVIPVDTFDPGYVTHGQDYDDGLRKGVESSAIVTVHTGFPTGSHKEIYEKTTGREGSAEKGTSEDPDNNKIFIDDPSKAFTYSLFFDNKNTDTSKKLTKLVFADPLPQTDDKLAITDTRERNSEFKVVFAESPNVHVYYVDIDDKGNESLPRVEIGSSDYTVEYSVNYDKSSIDASLSGDAADGVWHKETGLNVANDRSIRVIINDSVGNYLNTTDSTKYRRIIVEFDAKVSGESEPGQIAWNNFAYRYTYTDSSSSTSVPGKTLTSQPPVVGIQFPSVPKIEKSIINTDGSSYEFSEAKTFRFLIYRSKNRVNITDFTESGIHTAIEAANTAAADPSSKVDQITIATVTVDSGKSSGELMLKNIKQYKWNEGSKKYEEDSEAFTWEADSNGIKDYHIVEIADDPDTEFATFNGAADRQFDFAYNRAVDLVIKAENRIIPWSAVIVKTDKDTGAALSGAEFALYSTRENDKISDDEGILNDTVSFDGKTLYLFKKKLETGSDGSKRIDNLTENEYYIIETKAPDGYNIDNSNYVKIERGAAGVAVTAKFTDTKKPEPTKLGSLEVLKTMNGGSEGSFDFTITLTFPSKGIPLDNDGYLAKQLSEEEGGGKETLKVNWEVTSPSPAGLFTLPQIIDVREPMSGQSGAIEKIKPGDVQAINVTLSVNSKISITGLPDGTIYTITETTKSDNIKPKTETVSGAISVDDAKDVRISYENIKFSKVSFTKKILPEDGNTDREFSFILTFKNSAGKTLSDAYSYTVTSGARGTVKSGGIISGIKHNDTVTVEGLPVGTRVYIGEYKPSDGYIDIDVDGKELEVLPEGGMTYYGRTVEVKEEASAITFTNTVPDGKLKITKTVQNPGDFADGAIFRFRILLRNSSGTPVSGEFTTKTYNSESVTSPTVSTVTFDKNGVGYVEAEPGQSVEISGLPTGAKYTVTEESGRVGGKEIDPSTYGSFVTSEQDSIPIDGEKLATVEVLNFKSSEFRLTKRTSGDSLSGEGFAVTVTVKELPTWVSGSVPAVARVYTSGGTQRGSTINLNAAVNSEFRATLYDGDTLVITGLPAETKLSVSEPAGDYIGVICDSSGKATFAQDSTITLADEKTEAELINAETGSLTLSKTVSGVEPDHAGLFEFNIEFTPTATAATGNKNADALLENIEEILKKVTYAPKTVEHSVSGNVITVKIKAGESVTISGLPTGTGYEITEKTDKYNVTYGEAAGANTGTIFGGATVEVGASNTLKTGSLSVTKILSGEGTDLNDRFDFTVTFTTATGVTKAEEYDPEPASVKVEWTKDESGNTVAKFSLGASETVKFKGVPYGTQYTVAEDKPNEYGYTTTYGGDISSTISADTPECSVTATNSRGTGSLAIKKALSKSYGDEPESGFEIHVTFTDADGSPLVGTYNYVSSAAGRNGSITLDGGTGVLYLLGGETVTISGLPNGAKYTVAETESADFNAAYEKESGAIDENATVTANVTNTRKTGTLEIKKTLKPAGAASNDDFTFDIKLYVIKDGVELPISGTFSYTVGEYVDNAVFEDGKASVTLKAGQTAVFDTLPVNAHYTVSERLKDNYSLEKTGDEGTINVKTASTAEFVNTVLKPDYTISKVLGEGDSDEIIFVEPGESVTYTITVTGTGDEGSVSENISFEDKIPTWLKVSKTEITPADKGITENTDETVTEFVKYSWKIPKLKCGETVTVKITATVDKTITESKVLKNVVTTPGKPDDPSDEIESDPGKLKLSKRVTDIFGAERKTDSTEFSFTITLSLPADSPEHLRESYPYKINEKSGDLIGTVKTVDGEQVGTYEIKLKNGETVEISDLPVDTKYGASYNITEDLPTGYTQGAVTGSQGTISADGATAQFTNIYNPTPKEASLGITKNLTGELPNEKFSFTFEAVLQSINGTDKAAVPNADKAVTILNSPLSIDLESKSGDKEVSKNGEFKFRFSAAGVYVFEISEKPDNIPAVHYDSEKYTVKFTVTDDEKGGLDVSDPVITGSDKVKFNNTFDPTAASLLLSATKKLSGKIRSEDSFDFTVLVKKIKHAGVEVAENEQEKTIKDMGLSKMTGDVVIIDETYKEAGEYVYKVTEKDTSEKGITYDKSEYTVTVMVTANEDGTLHKDVVIKKKTAEGEDEVDDITFENSYAPDSVSKALSVSKSISGRDWKESDNKAYGFVLRPADPDSSDKVGRAGILPAEKKELSAKAETNGEKTGGIAVFDEITFTEAGNYYYTISEEDIPADIHGIEKDAKTVTAVVSVTDVGGKLEAEVKYGGAQSVEFVNKFTPGKAVLGGTKIISGRSWTADDSGVFEFTLTPTDGAPMPEGSTTENGVTSITASATTSNDGKSGTFAFPSIAYKEPGTYQYEIKETGGSADRITNDTNKITATVVVDDELNATVRYVYSGGSGTAFVNTYKQIPVTAKFEASKTISGRSWSNGIDSGRYSFTLKPQNAGNPMPNGSVNGVYTSFALDGGEIGFPEITFETIGTYSYEIAENKYDSNGITSSDDTFIVTVNVEDSNGDGALEKTVSYEGGKVPEFVNKYACSNAEFAVKIQKTLLDGDEKQPLDGHGFTFTMVEGENPGGGMILPENKTAEASDKLGGAEFEKITFTKPGSYSVTVKETAGTEKIDYDPRTLTVKFEVTEDKSTGALSVDAKYEFNGVRSEPAFENKAIPPVPHISIEKTQQQNEGEPTKDKLEVKPGDLITYYLKVTSDGEENSVALDVIVTDEIPEGLILDSISNNGTEENGVITWRLGNMERGESITVSFTVKVPAEGDYWLNVAKATYKTPDEPDTPKDVPSNEVEIVKPVPHISIEKTQQQNDGEPTKDKLEVKPGDLITYYLKVTSDGEENSVALDVTVTDEIPEGLILDSISNNGKEENGVITWRLGNMEQGESITVSFTVKVPAEGDYWLNVAKATYKTPDEPDTPKDVPSNEVEIEEECGSLTIRKTVGGNAGDPVSAFGFLIILTDKNGDPLSESYPYSGSRSGTVRSGETLMLAHGESVTIEGLPVGTQYEITETDSRGHTVRSTGDTGEISAETPAIADFVNILNIIRPEISTGSLTVGKTVGEGGDASREFAFTVRFFDQSGREISGSFTYNGSKIGSVSSGGTILLKHGESVTITGLPAGTVYSVAEVPDDGYISVSTGETGTVIHGGEEVASFVNLPAIDSPSEAGHAEEELYTAPDDPVRSHTAAIAALILAAAFAAASVALIKKRR